MRFTKAELLAKAQEALDRAHALEGAMSARGGSNGRRRCIEVLSEVASWRHASRAIADYAHGLPA